MKYSFWKVLFSQWSIKNDIKSFMLLFVYQIIMVCGISIGAGGLPIATSATLFTLCFLFVLGLHHTLKFVVFSLLYLLVTYMANQGEQKAIDLYTESLTWRK